MKDFLQLFKLSCIDTNNIILNYYYQVARAEKYNNVIHHLNDCIFLITYDYLEINDEIGHYFIFYYFRNDYDLSDIFYSKMTSSKIINFL